MKDKKVKEIMIPLSDYATVSEDDTLETAIRELKAAQKDTKHIHKHRAVLAYDKDGNITGKISFACILHALEPKYRQLEHHSNSNALGLSRFGLDDEYLNSLVENYSLWDETLDELVKKASKLKIKEIMYSLSDGEYVDEDVPVSEAIHQFILGCRQSLLVVKNEKVVGILRLPELFNLVYDVLE